MGIFSTPKVSINGTLDTGNSVLQNMNDLADAAMSFITWDPRIGGWKVIQNGPVQYDPPFSVEFTNDNIVGSINMSTSPISEIYNSVSVNYPDVNLYDETNQVTISIDSDELYNQESDNQLNLNLKFTNNPVQAAFIGRVELKQSRADKIIEFKTDYSMINDINAGDVIILDDDVLFDSSTINYTPYRIISIEEIEDQEGGIILSVTAIEYEDNIYGTSGLSIAQIDKKHGIKSAQTNICVIEKKTEAVSNAVAESLNTDTGRENLTKDIQVGNSIISIPLFQTEQEGWGISEITAAYGGGTVSPGSITSTWETYRPIKTCLVTFEAPQGDCVFDIDGVDKTFTALGVPTGILIYTRPFDVLSGQGIGSFQLATVRYMEWSSYFTQISLNADRPIQFQFIAQPLVTYDLNTNNNPITLKSASNFISNADGAYATLTVAAFLN